MPVTSREAAPPKSSISSPSKTFPQFPQLPPELRSYIWYLTSHMPRVLEVNGYETTVSFRRVARLTSKTIVPAILHTTRESRSIGLKYYEKLSPTMYFSKTYVNWGVDWIYLDITYEIIFRLWYTCVVTGSPLEMMKKCQRLILGPYQRQLTPMKLLEQFSNLKEVAPIYLDDWETVGSIADSHRLRDTIDGTVGSTIEIRELDDVSEDVLERYKQFPHSQWPQLCARNYERVLFVRATRGAGRPNEKAKRGRKGKKVRLAGKETKASKKVWSISEFRVAK